MRKVILAVAITTFSCLMTVSAYAGNWVKNNTGWWYDNGNGTWPSSSWQWIDGNSDGIAECYYFDGSGYCMLNTTTPDNYSVNNSGAWTVNGVVQTKNAGIEKSDSYYMEKYASVLNKWKNDEAGYAQDPVYDFIDINGNGSKELIIGDRDNGFISGIYTLNNETPVQIVIDPGVSDWRFNVLKGGYISTSNSNASWDTNSLSILDSNDNRVWVSTAYYKHLDGEAEVYEVNDVKVSREAYINELKKYNIEKENIRLTRSFK
ncbi:hypothetical protein [Lachnoanaerobaculum orale]|mgnify:FL=1|jgi:cysteine-rich secretory protein family./putative cell wall binding repeat|uniref:hypothetical protein n=1 Tax=Lachnoanaerobaculum orale TaxID=979627 RepID=UPI0023A8013C|nr:hypothetical protein [Lachnoanaerobaculum orale]